MVSCGSRKGADNAKMILLEYCNVGIGARTPAAKLSVQGGAVSDAIVIGRQDDMFTASYSIRMSSTCTVFDDDKVSGAEISTDINGYMTLMIIGNKATSYLRSVSA